jgi:hypothetical protein
MELGEIERLYPYFDAREWRILKAKDASGGFVTTDHPVCVHRPGGPNYGQQFAPGLGLSDRDILFPLSSKVALMGRLEGDEGVMEVDRQTVASFNAAVMGYAIGQKIEIWTDKASQNSGITRNTSMQRAMEVV